MKHIKNSLLISLSLFKLIKEGHLSLWCLRASSIFILGKGYESTVLHVKTRTFSKVFKIFNNSAKSGLNEYHPAGSEQRLVRPSSENLRVLEKVVFRNLLVGPIKLLDEKKSQKIFALSYDFKELRTPELKELFDNNGYLFYSLIEKFLECQKTLIDKVQLAIADGGFSNFLLDSENQWHYIDIGNMIVPLNDFRVLEEHYLNMGLFDVIFIPIEKKTKPLYKHELWKENYSSDITLICNYFPWLKDAMFVLKNADTMNLSSPIFYEKLLHILKRSFFQVDSDDSL